MLEFLLPMMMAFGSGMQAGGEIGAGQQAKAMGRARQQEANFEAAQLDQQAGQEIAASQRAAQEERRQARFAASRAQAVAAASGAGASDTTVKDLISDIAAEGSYRAAVALYRGDETARRLRMQANADRYSGEVMAAAGKAEQNAANIRAVSTLLAGGASLYEKYGMQKQKPEPAPTPKGYAPTMARRGAYGH